MVTQLQKLVWWSKSRTEILTSIINFMISPPQAHSSRKLQKHNITEEERYTVTRRNITLNYRGLSYQRNIEEEIRCTFSEALAEENPPIGLNYRGKNYDHFHKIDSNSSFGKIFGNQELVYRGNSYEWTEDNEEMLDINIQKIAHEYLNLSIVSDPSEEVQDRITAIMELAIIDPQLSAAINSMDYLAAAAHEIQHKSETLKLEEVCSEIEHLISNDELNSSPQEEEIIKRLLSQLKEIKKHRKFAS